MLKARLLRLRLPRLPVELLWPPLLLQTWLPLPQLVQELQQQGMTISTLSRLPLTVVRLELLHLLVVT
jgi:hypothetical protein